MNGDYDSVSGKSAPQDYFKCNTCGFVAFGEDPAIAEETICLGCGSIMGEDPPTKRSASPNAALGYKQNESSMRMDVDEGNTKKTLLVTCESCSQKFSKRAEACPKCGWKLQITCQICHQKIPLDSTICPECGDPSPFGLQENLRIEKLSDATIKDNPSERNIETKKPYPWKRVLIWILLIFVGGVVGARPPEGIYGNTAIAIKLVFALTYAVLGGVVIGAFKYFWR